MEKGSVNSSKKYNISKNRKKLKKIKYPAKGSMPKLILPGIYIIKPVERMEK